MNLLVQLVFFSQTDVVKQHASKMSNDSKKTLASIAAPAVQAVVAPVVAERKQNPKEKAAIDKGLAEVRVERIRVDGLVSGVWCGRTDWRYSEREGKRHGEVTGRGCSKEQLPFFSWQRGSRGAEDEGAQGVARGESQGGSGGFETRWSG